MPKLATLSIEVSERRDGSPMAELSHIRRVVVDHAAALFVLPCGDARCKDGGHDVTRAVMAALRAGETRFEGEDVCLGSVGTSRCSRVCHYLGAATYA